MNKNEWYQVGEDIKKQVQHAIDTNDFSELSKSIGETVNHAANDVGKSLNDVGKSINDIVSEATVSFQQGMKQSHEKEPDNKRQKWERYNGSVYYGKPNVRPNPKLFSETPPGSISGGFCMLLGFGAMGIATLTAVYNGLGILVGMESVTALSLPVTAMVAGGALGTYGTGVRNRVERYQRYVELVKDKLYYSIDELAERTGKSKRFVRRDLKCMIKKRMFLQAHMDKQENCFIASDSLYEQYMLTQNQYEQAQIEKKTEEADTTDSKVTKILEEGREYIRIIRQCNDEIPGEEMSEKLDKLELLVTRIFARVEESPELAPDLQKMLHYYLPTTQKLVEAYRELDKQNLEVKNVSDTKKEIEKSVDTINMAFEGFLDDLFRDRAWDIQSDISALNTMLKQDGYLKSDFEKGEKE